MLEDEAMTGTGELVFWMQTKTRLFGVFFGILYGIIIQYLRIVSICN